MPLSDAITEPWEPGDPIPGMVSAEELAANGFRWRYMGPPLLTFKAEDYWDCVAWKELVKHGSEVY